MLEFSGGTVRYATGSSDILYSGNTYTAIGGKVEFGSMQETPALDGTGISLTLSGVDQGIVNDILGDNLIGRNATLFLVHFTAGAIVTDPIQFGPYMMNGGWEVAENYDQGGGTVTVTTTMEGMGATFKVIRGIQMNVQSHQQIHSADTIFNKVVLLAGKTLLWGSYRVIRRPGHSDGTGPGDDPGTFTEA